MITLVGGHDQSFNEDEEYITKNSRIVARVNWHWLEQHGRIDALYTVHQLVDPPLEEYLKRGRFKEECRFVATPAWNHDVKKWRDVMTEVGGEHWGWSFDIPWLRDLYIDCAGWPLTGTLALSHLLRTYPDEQVYITGMNFFDDVEGSREIRERDHNLDANKRVLTDIIVEHENVMCCQDLMEGLGL